MWIDAFKDVTCGDKEQIALEIEKASRSLNPNSIAFLIDERNGRIQQEVLNGKELLFRKACRC